MYYLSQQSIEPYLGKTLNPTWAKDHHWLSIWAQNDVTGHRIRPVEIHSEGPNTLLGLELSVIAQK
jgi:hypothetical protein